MCICTRITLVNCKRGMLVYTRYIPIYYNNIIFYNLRDYYIPTGIGREKPCCITLF